jgi:hypothetical protein
MSAASSIIVFVSNSDGSVDSGIVGGGGHSGNSLVVIIVVDGGTSSVFQLWCPFRCI